MSKVRKQVYLELRQDALIKQISEMSGVSEAEVIRQALDSHLVGLRQNRQNLELWVQEKSFIQDVKARPRLPNLRDWRREDLYER